MTRAADLLPAAPELAILVALERTLPLAVTVLTTVQREHPVGDLATLRAWLADDLARQLDEVAAKLTRYRHLVTPPHPLP